jgi:hypothetical protein
MFTLFTTLISLTFKKCVFSTLNVIFFAYIKVQGGYSCVTAETLRICF